MPKKQPSKRRLMKLVLSPQAERDLTEIRAYLLSQNPPASVRYADLFQRAFDHLAFMPSAGHQTAELESRDLRVWTVEPYLILYAANTDPIAIVRVFHEARNVRVLLGLEPETSEDE